MRWMRSSSVRMGAVALALAALAAVVVSSAVGGKDKGRDSLQKVNHIVVIYEENHSFDNLYGGWEGVNGLSKGDTSHMTQVDQSGAAFSCLRQNDVNLAAMPSTCADTAHGINSAFTNKFFTIDSLLPPTATTCPPPLKAFSFPNGVPNGQGQPGGCTRDLVHKFYQEQYQLNGGAQNRYMVGSDAIGMTMGVYYRKQLPISKYLHGAKHPHYAIADNFFQAAFGGSFLNHQYLIAARAPEDPNAPANQHSLLDANGFPQRTYPLY